MSTRKWLIVSGAVTVAALVILALAVTLSQAQGVPGEIAGVRGADEAAAVASRIPVQGRLTDAGGNPLNGTFDLTFRLYNVSSGGTALCSDTNSVSVNDGLFSSDISGDCDSSALNGRQVFLGVEVESDGEMNPRQPIFPVPYAWSLRPGAIISDTRTDPVLTVNNYGSGTGVQVRSEEGVGVAAWSKDEEDAAVRGGNESLGAGVRGTSLGGIGVNAASFLGVGLEASSFSSVTIKASGTGIIQSSAKSYVWISGNGVRPFKQSDSTVIDMDTIGGAFVYPSVTAAARNVMLPITVPGPLYGQDVTITDLDIYWNGSTDMDAITAVLLRRQTGVCNSCYVSILADFDDHTCLTATGCTLHYDLMSNNVLTSDSGILYLTVEVTAVGVSSWIEIGGVRLTLEHD